ncbi:multidrug effflux MFS transporter [Helcobacillus massiliensis]|uniref:multidrug effflux MFS transporter n=1 Tax=Helcobacillus massiliensis TaxID=521392 RepID=UPI002556D3E8|nr:multidrug effflux MFS transporter [Helcobacillus massiliensis]MDK7742616.1 multidrug effflux MFS transporter [Helcobacillus massiliensis]WOO92555.1 multidrug effflux MFS transporter [Helcobacillus massiliensis]
MPATRAKSAHLGALTITILTALAAIGPLATDMYIPAFPEVAADLTARAAHVQLTLTAFFAGAAAGQVVAGPLSDRLGRRVPLISGTLLCLVGSIGCALAPSIGWLLIFRVMQGMGGGFGMVLSRAILIDLARGPELFRSMNLLQGMVGIAPIIAPLIGGVILIVGSWREVFIVIATATALSLIALVLRIPESLPRQDRQPGGFRTFARNVARLLRRPAFTSYLLVNAFSAFALMAYVSASSFVVQNLLGFSSTVYSISFAVNATGMMLASFTSARLTQTRSPRSLMRWAIPVVIAAGAFLLIGVLLLGTPAWVVFPAFFLTVAPQGFIFGNGAAMASREATDMAGTASAMIGLGFACAASLAAPVVGLAGEGSALPAAIGIFVGGIISLILFVVAGRFERASA